MLWNGAAEVQTVQPDTLPERPLDPVRNEDH
ncbi:MAG: hypothetical protein QOG10_2703 [Kribbellaceae bacterium]|nr:hypothetical protein [Kribbellaceae bacterium]